MATTKQNSDDRFSDLPDEIVHRFLSHLPMTDLAQLSAVSKRCRELCISNPTLSVRISWVRSNACRRGFCNFLDRLIALRCLHKVRTQRFRLEWTFHSPYEDDEDRVRRWLQHAVNSNVEDIYLETFYPQKRFSLPPSVLGCKSLRSLEIRAHDLPLQLPSSLPIPSFADKLQVLVLRGLNTDNLDTDNQRLGEWFSCFKSLRLLKLEQVSEIKTIAITNSSVETLVIEISDDELRKIDIQKVQKLHHLFIDWNAFDSPGSKSMKISAPNLQTLSIIWDTPCSHRTSLEISAPNLQTFQWFGNAVDDYCMENSPNLSYASVALLPRSESRVNHFSTKHSLEKVLHSIRGTKSLTLWNDFVQVLYIHGCLPFLFDNAEHLAIRGTLSSSSVETLSSLLRGTTNLKHLILVKNLRPSKWISFKGKYEKSQNLRFTRLLETIAVEFFDGKNEVEQIKHVLEDAEEVFEDEEELLEDAEEVSEDDEGELLEDVEEVLEDEEELHEDAEALEEEEELLEDEEELLEDAEELEMMAILSTSPVSQDFIAEFKEFMISFPWD